MDTRPPRSCFAHYDVPATITPVGGASYAAHVSRVPPQSGAPNIEVDATVVDRPRFRLWRTEAPGLDHGTTILIPDGPDAGTYTVSHIDRVDHEVLEVIA